MKSFKTYYEEDEKQTVLGPAIEPINQSDISIPGIKFDKYKRVVLSKKVYSGKYNNIECKLIKFKDDAPYEIEISLLNDPNIKGKVSYEKGSDAIVAFNSIDNLNQCLKYMTKYLNNNESYKWQVIINDEGIGSEGPKNVEPFSASPSQDAGSPLGPIGSSPSFGAEPSPSSSPSPSPGGPEINNNTPTITKPTAPEIITTPPEITI